MKLKPEKQGKKLMKQRTRFLEIISKIDKYLVRMQRKKNLPINFITLALPQLYAKNYTMLQEEIKDRLNKWRAIPFSQIGRLNLVMMSTFLKLVCIIYLTQLRSYQNPSKMLCRYR